MSKDAKPAETAGDGAAPKKSKKLLIIIIAVLVLVLGGGGAAAYLLMHKSADHGDEEDAAPEKPSKKKKAEKEAPPSYVAFEAFTVNLIPESGDQFLQLMISVEVTDAAVGDKIKLYTPKIRNKVTLLLSDKKASELITKSGKETLAEELRDEINGILEPSSKGKKDDGPIKEVLFTSFIIQ
jgi:flagellar FliL protein